MDWVGRRRTRKTVLAAQDLARLAAVLDRPAPTAEVPPAWHWACLAEPVRRADLGPDGHPRRGLHLPPIEAPRRMFAASDMTFAGPLRPDQETEVTDTIAAIEEKAGASGPLTFVTVDRVFSQAGATRVRERQTIVYTATSPAPRTPDAEPAPPAEWSRETPTDPVLLFAFSAATANGHRIHYDQAYATKVEGYAGLVVHGPLIALLLLEAMPKRPLMRFSFRALKPAFAGETITAEGRLVDGGAELWARSGGAVLMRAKAAF
ncbi:FAS1-like dehydratase domain-containing protein [Caulobacter sp. RL271]|jgi:3-methylfumaryl-CoA hydratase|uniref:MaoC family dehydratase N-terminal domain-containing protein n=1 Tax=Caulobacter segnis TaxID=88688 RepID=A0ABY4ZQH1_9CAUL|nr:MaoC family dehydratase N-terminal domain-containing protein [Caulobacter segnis]USQ94780.1 MaoC family dehydratase N-terminal domain-containing protein [Caulobacter segnis]